MLLCVHYRVPGLVFIYEKCQESQQEGLVFLQLLICGSDWGTGSRFHVEETQAFSQKPPERVFPCGGNIGHAEARLSHIYMPVARFAHPCKAPVLYLLHLQLLLLLLYMCIII